MQLIFFFFILRECGTAGALVLQPFNILFFPLRDCWTAGALVLDPFNILFFFNSGSAGSREQYFHKPYIH